MIKTYYKNGDFATVTYRVLGGDYGLHKRSIMKAIVKNFDETEHHHFALVCESTDQDSNMSIPHRSQELELPYGTLWRISYLGLHIHPYKITIHQFTMS